MPEVERIRTVGPVQPGGEPVCSLTADAAATRAVPIDRLLERGALEPTASGYRIALPDGEASWRLANDFADEESACCPALRIEVQQRDGVVEIRASF